MANEGSSGYKYGSVSNDEEIGATGGDKSFDESDLYYMKEEERTRKEKFIKAIKLAVPILIAAMLVFGLGFLLFQNFGYFYPGRTPSRSGSSGGSGGYSSSASTSSSTSSKKTSTPAQSSHYDNIAKIAVGSSCEANPKCADLGLTGECCPTGGGIKLNCCS